LLSTQTASRSQRRAALVVALLMLVTCMCVLPFAGVAGKPSPSFAVAQQVVLALNDLITAALLFGQYAFQQVRGFITLASGYLFTALMSISWLLSFPGVFAESGLLIPEQITPWLYTAWYVALPLAIIVYGLTPVGIGTRRGRTDILVTVSGVVGAVVGITAIIVLIRDWLPVLVMVGDYTMAQRVVCAVLTALAFAALLVLVRRRPFSVLDLWLMTGMLAWMFSMILVSVISSRRFDVPAYAGRLLGVLGSTFVLVVLLSEMNVLYARVVRSAASEREERERRLNEMGVILIHLSRVNELGQHVSTLIHEIAQPLAAISMLAQTSMRLANGSTERLKQSLEALADAAAKARDIVQHLRGFITSNKPDRGIHQVREMIEDAIRLASLGDVSALMIYTRYHPAATTAFCDRVQIEQVVFNLVRNAIEATASDTRPVLTIATDTTPEGLIQISIADKGPGLPSAVRAKLFEPFVTTKASGLGVGLSICRLIIEAHGGQLRAEDNPGGGTIFCFTLPQG
jgi:signal transduction histidine kinase